MVEEKQTIVVVGLGMVGLRFIEKLLEYDNTLSNNDKHFQVITFCEEPYPAYNRVGLTQFFEHRSAEKLLMIHHDWYQSNNICVHLNDKVIKIDRDNKVVISEKGVESSYDYLVLATGSYAFVPPVKGIESKGVFVYRTIEDIHQIIEFSQRTNVRRAAVVGGGLLGLEAAKAVTELGLKVSVVERNRWLLNRQLDQVGGGMLTKQVEELGISVKLGLRMREIVPLDTESNHVGGIAFENSDEFLKTDCIIVSVGIRPRDELARDCGLNFDSTFGGVIVDDYLKTNDPSIFAIGEVASHRGLFYGLVGPGYEMADILAWNLSGKGREHNERVFIGGDCSTKLKLLGVQVASFGQYNIQNDRALPLVYNDPFGNIYKKLVFSKDGTRLMGGILLGETSEYGSLLALTKSKLKLTISPSELMFGPKREGNSDAKKLPDNAQICSCNNVTAGQIRNAIKDKKLDSVGAVKGCTKAGTGCGGCIPEVTDIFNATMASLGKVITNHLCEHFSFSRRELFDIIKVKGIKTFKELLENHGRGSGCEVCKPTIASVLASLWNDHILDHASLQDTNDRFLANIQRGGSFSVVPRVPGGEITPDKLIVLGQVAKKFGLYTKITGGQRVDLFGAKKYQLPEIWEELVDAGFESGHAYGKALRTVKSCVGSSWCRYGIGDSVGFAIRIENRYKGIRAPHKIKGAVSGCIRECAEAQGKDFGLIATDKGYNVYVCGNGGSRPKHAILLAADVDPETCIKYIDRFLMFYIVTADRLTRTARWLEQLEPQGGIEYLRDVIIRDKLGICTDLEVMMANLIDTYQCEWATVVRNPEKRKTFRQFVNDDEKQEEIEFIKERGQHRPVDWPKDGTIVNGLPSPPASPEGSIERRKWVKCGTVSDFPPDGGAVVKYGNSQIAVFNFATRNEWYATQNMCPHKKAFVLSQGLLGDSNDVPKVACPNHKKTFSLQDGACLTGDTNRIETFPVKIENGLVYIELPDEDAVDAKLATKRWLVRRGDAELDAEIIKNLRVANATRYNDGSIEMGRSGCETVCGNNNLDW